MKEIELYEKHGFRLFPLRGKKPTVKEWQKTKFKQNEFPKSFKGNFGVCLSPIDLVIDVDPRGFKENDKPHQRLSSIVPEMKDTLVIETGGGGLHIYFTKPEECVIKKNLKEYQGIDFLSAGRYVVGAGSIHPDSKKPYKVVSGSFDKVLPAPSALLDLIEANPRVTTEGDDFFDNSMRTQLRFADYLKDHAPVAISGQGGNDTTFKVACRGRDFALDEETTWALMVSNWNDRCEPAWDEDELRGIVINAYKFNQDSAGKFHPSNQFEAVDYDFKVVNSPDGLEVGESVDIDIETEPDFTWHLNKQGEWQRNSIHNVCNFFGGYLETKELDKLLRFNTLSQSIEFTRRPFWLHKNSPMTAWDDNDANAVMKYLSTKLAFNANKNLIHDTALAVASENMFNPIIDYLESQTWDGIPRIHNWLTTYVRVNETEYSKAVGELLLRAAIRRVYDSGCKYDYMVVFEGDEGIGKSTFCEILGQNWYADLILNVHSPDTVDCMRNKWIIEVSEMECTKRAEAKAMRSFLSRRTDTVRLAYARTSKDFPRHNIFIGTFNPEPASSYLKDETNNRRYLPIFVEGTEFLDFKKFKKDVGQLWAEALVSHRENPKKPLYLIDKNVYKQAKKETEQRRDVDSWTDLIVEWLENPDGGGVPKMSVSATEIWTHALGGDKDKLGAFQFRRISNVMVNELEWRKTTKRVNNITKRTYERPEKNLIDHL